MTRRKTGGRDFQHGNTFGKGRPKIHPELKGEPKIDRDSYNKKLNHVLNATREELNDILSNPKATMLELWLANTTKIGTQKGDPIRLEAYLNRAIGRIPQPLEHSGKDGEPIEINNTLENLSDEQIKLMALETIKLLEGKK